MKEREGQTLNECNDDSFSSLSLSHSLTRVDVMMRRMTAGEEREEK